jgi:hypothetical protein
MLELLIVVVRALTLALRGHRELVLENLALRQQLGATVRRSEPASGRAIDSFGLPSAKLAKLAQGIDCRATGHRRPVASRLASPPMDATLATSTGWPSAD